MWKELQSLPYSYLFACQENTSVLIRAIVHHKRQLVPKPLLCIEKDYERLPSIVSYCNIHHPSIADPKMFPRTACRALLRPPITFSRRGLVTLEGNPHIVRLAMLAASTLLTASVCLSRRAVLQRPYPISPFLPSP